MAASKLEMILKEPKLEKAFSTFLDKENKLAILEFCKDPDPYDIYRDYFAQTPLVSLDLPNAILNEAREVQIKYVKFMKSLKEGASNLAEAMKKAGDPATADNMKRERENLNFQMRSGEYRENYKEKMKQLLDKAVEDRKKYLETEMFLKFLRSAEYSDYTILQNSPAGEAELDDSLPYVLHKGKIAKIGFAGVSDLIQLERISLLIYNLEKKDKSKAKSVFAKIVEKEPSKSKLTENSFDEVAEAIKKAKYFEGLATRK